MGKIGKHWYTCIFKLRRQGLELYHCIIHRDTSLSHSASWNFFLLLITTALLLVTTNSKHPVTNNKCYNCFVVVILFCLFLQLLFLRNLVCWETGKIYQVKLGMVGHQTHYLGGRGRRIQFKATLDCIMSLRLAWAA
jgi:hypothetical protein